MRVAICGYGRMGQEVEQILLARGHSVVSRIDPAPDRGDNSALKAADLKGCDGVIEFSLADAVAENARTYIEAGVPAVVGTTGWEDARGAVQSEVDRSEIGYLVGSNFSIGANLMFALTEQAAAIINSFPEYDIMVQEYHHTKKKDSPSGTALTLAKKIVEQNRAKTEIVTECLHRQIEAHELHVASVRGGSIPGIHTVTLDSPADTISLTHSARNRSGFAGGAVAALEWLQGRRGFFTVDDFIADLIARSTEQ